MRPKTFTYILLFLLLSIPAFSSVQDKAALEVHFIDVGYGDAIYISLPNGQYILVDAGGRATSKQLLAYLTSLNVKSLDSVIITHPHENHFGGLEALQKLIPIKKVFINGDTHVDDGYSDLLSVLAKKEIPIRPVKAGEYIEDSEGYIKVLWPQHLNGSTNGNSIVLHLVYGKTAILLTGDIGPEEQENIFPQLSEVDLVKYVQVPHHGKGISVHFINKFKGKNLVISTGTDERGGPDEKEIQMLGPVLRTDHDGTIVVLSDGEKMWHNTFP